MAKTNKYYNLSTEGTRIAKKFAGFDPGKSGRNLSEGDEPIEVPEPLLELGGVYSELLLEDWAEFVVDDSA